MDICERLKYLMTASIPCLILILFILIAKSGMSNINYGRNPIPQIGKYQGLRNSITPQPRPTTRYP